MLYSSHPSLQMHLCARMGLGKFVRKLADYCMESTQALHESRMLVKGFSTCQGYPSTRQEIYHMSRVALAIN